MIFTTPFPHLLQQEKAMTTLTVILGNDSPGMALVTEIQTDGQLNNEGTLHPGGGLEIQIAKSTGCIMISFPAKAGFQGEH